MGQISLQIPSVGQPNSTEDPKVASDFTVIQATIDGGIDPSNLNPTGGVLSMAWRNGAANLNANAGDWIVAAAGITVTLPAPALNAVVAVTANSSVSGGSPVTVAYGSAVIFGPGMSGGVSSFVLGSPLASAILQGNGSQWVIRDGQQDTGWVALGLALNVIGAANAWTPAARKQGDTVRLRGMLQNNTGGSLVAATWATVPAGMAPPTKAYMVGLAASATPTDVDTSGNLIVAGNQGNGVQAQLDGLSYSL